MKQKFRFRHFFEPPRSLISASVVLGTACFLNSCFLKQDRTTVVYGTITDQNGQPVDSILVMFQGIKWFNYVTLGEVWSDRNGSYEIIVEVPKKYEAANVLIPFGTYVNPKYEKYYKGYQSYKNDVGTGNCCVVSAGEKVKYDFQIIPR